MSRLKLLIATHKDYEFPAADYYFPIQVGKENNELDLSIQADNQGQNISAKNKSFCELTALYWAWKNLDNIDVIGLVHYRRYFIGNKLQVKGQGVLNDTEIKAILAKVDCIVPKKRNYYIETVEQHYANAHYQKDLDLVKEILFAKNPDYLTACNQVLNGKSLYLFNMFIMKSELFRQYCEWLFPILFELEQKIDISDYSAYQKRVFGFIAERLFNVWLVKNKVALFECKVVNLEKENLFLKALGLIRRKFLKNGKK